MQRGMLQLSLSLGLLLFAVIPQVFGDRYRAYRAIKGCQYLGRSSPLRRSYSS
jgi:hypothetical protein